MKRKLFIICLVVFSFYSFANGNKNYKMLVGTYTQATQSEGIYKVELNSKGQLVSKKLLAKSDNPSYLAFSPDKKFVYAVNEMGKESFVSAFAFDQENETLTFLNKTAVEGDPCYLTCTEHNVLTANYSGGTISVFGRNADGSLTDELQVIVHPRKQFGRGRTGPSNAHQIIPSPDGKFMMATNLGTDRVFTYKYHADSKDEILTFVDEIAVKKGSGPRHLAFSTNGKFLYLVQEISAGITVFSVAEDGRLSIIQETTLVVNSDKKNGAADIHLSPNGKYLYATNRGDANTISVFRVKKDGTLKKHKHYSTEGNGPRNFTISADGRFIFVGNQKTNNISVFRRGFCRKLKLVNSEINVDAPVCLLLY